MRKENAQAMRQAEEINSPFNASKVRRLMKQNNTDSLEFKSYVNKGKTEVTHYVDAFGTVAYSEIGSGEYKRRIEYARKMYTNYINFEKREVTRK